MHSKNFDTYYNQTFTTILFGCFQQDPVNIINKTVWTFVCLFWMSVTPSYYNYKTNQFGWNYDFSAGFIEKLKSMLTKPREKCKINIEYCLHLKVSEYV